MGKKIITVSREYGSGGRIIAKMAAEKLGVAFYDKELIALVAKESGFTLDFIEDTGEYSSPNLLFNMPLTGLYTFTDTNLSLTDKVHVLQSKIIHEIAEQESCVIVGRSADYILRDRDDCLNVFIHADMVHKKERAIKEYGISPKKAEKELEKIDKSRASHYRHYTGQIWGLAKNYHLSLDSGLFGLEICCDIIIDLAQR